MGVGRRGGRGPVRLARGDQVGDPVAELAELGVQLLLLGRQLLPQSSGELVAVPVDGVDQRAPVLGELVAHALVRLLGGRADDLVQARRHHRALAEEELGDALAEPVDLGGGGSGEVAVRAGGPFDRLDDGGVLGLEPRGGLLGEQLDAALQVGEVQAVGRLGGRDGPGPQAGDRPRGQVLAGCIRSCCCGDDVGVGDHQAVQAQRRARQHGRRGDRFHLEAHGRSSRAMAAMSASKS